MPHCNRSIDQISFEGKVFQVIATEGEQNDTGTGNQFLIKDVLDIALLNVSPFSLKLDLEVCADLVIQAQF